MREDLYIYTMVAGLLSLIQMAIVVGGIIIAIKHRRQHPRVSSMVLIAMTLLLANLVIGLAGPMLIGIFVNQLGGVDSYRYLTVAQSVLAGITRSIALVILLFAVFGWRQPALPIVDTNQAATDDPSLSYSDFDQN